MPGLCPAHSWRSPAECNRRRGHSPDARGPPAVQVHRRPALGYYVMSAVGKPVSIATLHLGHGIVTTVTWHMACGFVQELAACCLVFGWRVLPPPRKDARKPLPYHATQQGIALGLYRYPNRAGMGARLQLTTTRELYPKHHCPSYASIVVVAD